MWSTVNDWGKSRPIWSFPLGRKPEHFRTLETNRGWYHFPIVVLLLTLGLFFAGWLRYAVILALGAVPEDRSLRGKGPVELESEFFRLRGALSNTRRVEHWMVCAHFRLQQARRAMVGGFRPESAHRALEEMRRVVVYLAREAAAGPAAIQ